MGESGEAGGSWPLLSIYHPCSRNRRRSRSINVMLNHGGPRDDKGEGGQPLPCRVATSNSVGKMTGLESMVPRGRFPQRYRRLIQA